MLLQFAKMFRAKTAQATYRSSIRALQRPHAEVQSRSNPGRRTHVTAQAPKTRVGVLVLAESDGARSKQVEDDDQSKSKLLQRQSSRMPKRRIYRKLTKCGADLAGDAHIYRAPTKKKASGRLWGTREEGGKRPIRSRAVKELSTLLFCHVILKEGTQLLKITIIKQTRMHAYKPWAIANKYTYRHDSLLKLIGFCRRVFPMALIKYAVSVPRETFLNQIHISKSGNTAKWHFEAEHDIPWWSVIFQRLLYMNSVDGSW